MPFLSSEPHYSEILLRGGPSACGRGDAAAGPGTAHQFGRRGVGWPRPRGPGGRGLASAGRRTSPGSAPAGAPGGAGEEPSGPPTPWSSGGCPQGPAGTAGGRGRPGAAAVPDAGAASPGGRGARACRGGGVSRGAAVAERAGAGAAGRVPGLPAPHSLVRGDRRGSGGLCHAFLIQTAAVVTSPDGQRPGHGPGRTEWRSRRPPRPPETRRRPRSR